MAILSASLIQKFRAATALDRKETVSWALYDWANSAFATTVMAAVLPIFYSTVAAKDLPGNTATVYWGYTNSIALLIIAFISPVLGAIADFLGAKKRFMSAFATVGITFTGTLYFVSQGDWLLASILFILANIGFSGANVFYDSLLPHVVDGKRVDQLSASGYAIGYLGGGILLVINLLWISSPETFGMRDSAMAVRISMLSVSVWWAVFSVPIFRNVPEPHGPRLMRGAGVTPLREGFRRIRKTLKEIRHYRHVAVFLLAFWLYNDGIGTIVKMAAIYGTEIGIGRGHLIGALALVQFVGIPFALLFGQIARRIGPKPSIFIGLAVYAAISVSAYFMSQAWHFWALAVAVATVQGGCQALSRSLFASMIPRAKSSELFGFFSVFAKFSTVLGPFIFALVGQLTGNSRLSILALTAFFICGALLLSRVDVEEGRRIARAENCRSGH